MSVSIHSSRDLGNKKVKRRYKVILTDLIDIKHEKILGLFNHNQSNTGSEVEANYLERLKQQEIAQYESDVENEINPFLKDSKWNDRASLLKVLMDKALTGKATDPIVYNGLPYLASVTDNELKFLYGKDQIWVDNVRVKAQVLIENKNGLDSYQPVGV